MPSTPSTDHQKSVDEEARLWAVKMAGDQASELKAGLELWLSKSAHHREAYARARRNYLESAILRSSPKFGLDHRAPPQKLTPRKKNALAAGIAGVILISAAMSLDHAPNKPWVAGQVRLQSPLTAFAAEPLATKRGEIRIFYLEDGSSITLDSDSAAEIDFSPEIRTVHLSKGRARIEMAADPRPFHLRADGALVEGRKATIDVNALRPGNIAVSLIEGAARMSAGDGSPTAPLTLAPHQFGISSSGAASSSAVDSSNGRSDWTTGWAEHREVRLDALILAANRYAKSPIEIADKGLASTLVTGRFHIANTDQFLEHICALLDIRRRDLDGRTLLTEN